MSPPAGPSFPSALAPVAVPPPRFRWSTRVGLPLLLLSGLLLLLAGSLWSSLEPVTEVRATPVVEKPSINGAEVEVGAGSAALIQAAGWIEPDPFPIIVSALADGVVEEVLFLEGQSVKRGDPMVRLVDDDAALALRRAEANRAAAEEEWQANIGNQRSVEVAEAGVEETSASLALARAELQAEEVLLADAERIHRRRLAVEGTGAASESDLTAAQAEAALRHARTQAARLRIGVIEAEHRIAIAESTAARRTAELRTTERRQLELARVEVDEARLRLGRMVVVAPADGVVMRRLVEPGSRLVVAADDPVAGHVAQLYDPARLQVRVDVPLADAAKASVGMRAEIVVEILPDATFVGRVTRLGNRADIQKNTLPVLVAIESPDPRLKPDMLARVRLLATPESLVGNLADGRLSVFAPAKAITAGAAWVVTNYDGEEGIVRRRPVTTTGARDADWDEVGSGLRPGDLVVVDPTDGFVDGQRVRVLAQGGV